MNPHLDFLLSAVYDRSGLHPEHLADLRKSGLTDETIARQHFRTVPPDMIDRLLGFRAAGVRHAYVIPFPDLRGGWQLDHVKLKVFGDGDVETMRGAHVEVAKPERRRGYNGGARKYLGRREEPPRLFLVLATMDRALRGDEPLYLVEGEKKALAVGQLGLPAVGLESIWGWHRKAERDLLPDFDDVGLSGRAVEIIPDSDWRANAQINQSVHGLAAGLRHRGARVRVVLVPPECKGIDDFLVSRGHGAA